MNTVTEHGFRDQYILVAGGYRGIGLELARLLLSEGAQVALVGRTADHGEAAAKELAGGERLVCFTADLSNAADLKKVQEDVTGWCEGRLHHMAEFLGSGKTPFGLEIPMEQWRSVFEINTFAPIAVIQAFMPLMLHSEGNPSIAITSALAGVERVRAPVTYSVAKTALIAYANHLAQALVEKGVRVHCISPGNVFYKGGRWEEILAERGEEIDSFLRESVGMRRLGTAAEIAWTYFTTMSPRNSFMTGQNLVIDGLQGKKLI